eukprot:m.740312 g.740312  ORF g.740312 m.740312 type:complete len:859 (-) comp23114_c0_seq1:228-2804(-)
MAPRMLEGCSPTISHTLVVFSAILISRYFSKWATALTVTISPFDLLLYTGSVIVVTIVGRNVLHNNLHLISSKRNYSALQGEKSKELKCVQITTDLDSKARNSDGGEDVTQCRRQRKAPKDECARDNDGSSDIVSNVTICTDDEPSFELVRTGSDESTRSCKSPGHEGTSEHSDGDASSRATGRRGSVANQSDQTCLANSARASFSSSASTINVENLRLLDTQKTRSTGAHPASLPQGLRMTRQQRSQSAAAGVGPGFHDEAPGVQTTSRLVSCPSMLTDNLRRATIHDLNEYHQKSVDIVGANFVGGGILGNDSALTEHPPSADSADDSIDSKVYTETQLESIINMLSRMYNDHQTPLESAHAAVVDEVIQQLRACANERSMLTPRANVSADTVVGARLEQFGAHRAHRLSHHWQKTSLVEAGAERVARYMTISEQFNLDPDCADDDAPLRSSSSDDDDNDGKKRLSVALEDSCSSCGTLHHNLSLPGYAARHKSHVPLWQRGLSDVHITSAKLASWDFDPFEACGIDPDHFGRDLLDDRTVSGVAYAMRILEDHDIFDSVAVDRSAMKRYLRRIEREYQTNPYHNRVHALDVMQTCHCVLMSSPALKMHLSPLEKLALLLGAYVHDVGHPGLNNKLVTTLANSPTLALNPDMAQLAITYSNHSVLEYYHLATAFRIAFSSDEPNGNPFAALSTEDFALLRALMIELVLATDMEHHFTLVTKLKVIAGGGTGLLDLSNKDNKLILLKAVIHACDISNPAKPTRISQKWTHVISEEFYRQGDLETDLGMSPDKMHVRLDLDTPDGKIEQANGQLAFIRFIVKPLHEVLALQLPVFERHALKWLGTNTEHFTKLKASLE